LQTLFIAILDRKLVENRSPRGATPEEISLYHNALYWAKTELSKIAEVPTTLSSSFNRSRGKYPPTFSEQDRRQSLYTIVSDQALIDPGDPKNLEIPMLRYPIPGFMVLIRLMRDNGTSQERIQVHLFQRLIYHITEVYLKNLNSTKGAATKASLNEILGFTTAETTSAKLPDPATATVLPIESLLECHLIDIETVSLFRTLDGFNNVEKQMGPAIAVYLHALRLHATSHASAVECFNSLKTMSSLRNVILKPLAISEGLSADIIRQL